MPQNSQSKYTQKNTDERENYIKKWGGLINEDSEKHPEKEMSELIKKKKLSQIKDAENIQKIRQEINGTDQEKYNKLENVALCKQNLQIILSQFLAGQKTDNELVKNVSSIIYEMLTTKSIFIKHKEKAGGDLVKLMEKYKPQQEWYKKIMEKLEKYINNEKIFKCDGNPGWFGINTRPEVPKRDSTNIKVYTSIPIREYKYIRYIPQLAKELRKLSLASNDIIQVKIPESLTAFMAHQDSIVVHFKNKENSQKILEIISTWTKQNNITESPREMDRSRIGVDSKDKSFSELIGENLANWVAQNARKYDKTLLAEEAIKHAINQSQKSPI